MEPSRLNAKERKSSNLKKKINFSLEKGENETKYLVVVSLQFRYKYSLWRNILHQVHKV